MIEVLRLLNAIESGNIPSYSASHYVRHLEKEEYLPDTGSGLSESPLLQKDWIWVAYCSRTDKPLASLVAAPMQGIAMLLRINAIDSAPKSILVGLLRKSLADMKKRGYNLFATPLSLDRAEESQLARIIIKVGGVEAGSYTLFQGPTEIGKW